MSLRKTYSRVKIVLLFIIIIITISACGVGDNNSKLENSTDTNVLLTGEAVKGPLANADINVYRVDPNTSSFFGELAATGQTNEKAQFINLSIPKPLDEFYFIDVIANSNTIDLSTGKAPFFTKLNGIVTNDQLEAGTSISVTPLTTIAVNAGILKSEVTSSLEVILDNIFNAAVDITEIIGFGIDKDFNIFEEPAILQINDTDSINKIVRHRTTIEAIAAISDLIGSNISSDPNEILSALAEDLTDQKFDGFKNKEKIIIFESIENLTDLLDRTSIALLPIPNSVNAENDLPFTIDEVEKMLLLEANLLELELDFSLLQNDEINFTPSPFSTDTDNDAIPDLSDEDIDNDGITNSSDAFPYDKTESIDTDNDGIGNNVDPDIDGDGTANQSDDLPLDPTEQFDFDKDGVGDNSDNDDDNDSVVDNEDTFPFDSNESMDSDSDGVGDNADKFPLDPAEYLDSDGDSIGNNSDLDDDNDGVDDLLDAFPLNPSEQYDSDNDGIGDNADPTNRFIGDIDIASRICRTDEEPEILSNNIDTTQTIKSGCYQVIGQINITNNAILTIEPNTILYFEARGGLTINGGSIIAEGLPSKPIYFSSQVEQKGTWAGIRVWRRNAFPNKFKYVVIEYAGGPGFINGNGSFNVNDERIHSKISGKLTFTDNVVRDGAATYGAYVDENSFIAEFKNNTIYNNNYPIYTTANQAHLVGENTFEHDKNTNDNNFIVIGGRELKTIDSYSANNVTSVFWKKLSIPYLIKDNLQINETKLTINPGVKLYFKENAGLKVNTQNASLHAVGTENEQILMSSEDQVGGKWIGVQYRNTSQRRNQLHWVIIEFGGNSLNGDNANVSVGFQSEVSIQNTTLRLSSGYGFYVTTDGQLRDFSNNKITQNLEGAGLISSRAIKFLDDSSDFSGNTNNILIVEPENFNPTLDISATWPGINIPYAFYSNMTIAGNLEIEAGATLLFDEDKSLIINGSSSSLKAIGTNSKRIRFSALSQIITPGLTNFWQGIRFVNSSGNGNNVFDNVLIEYAGKRTEEITAAAIQLISSRSNDNSTLEIKNSNIKFNAPNSSAIYIDARSTLLDNNTSDYENGICKESLNNC